MPTLGPLHQDVCPLPGHSSLISLVFSVISSTLQLHPDAWTPNPFTLLRFLFLYHVALIFKHTIESVYYLHSLPSLFPPRM